MCLDLLAPTNSSHSSIRFHWWTEHNEGSSPNIRSFELLLDDEAEVFTSEKANSIKYAVDQSIQIDLFKPDKSWIICDVKIQPE